MIISNKPVPQSYSSVKINDRIIQRTHLHKFLGVTIDCKLKFKAHIDAISNKISKSIGILYKLSSYLPPSTMRNLYFAFVNSYLMYCYSYLGYRKKVFEL